MTNEALIKKFYSEIWNQSQEETAYEILSPQIKFRGSTGPSKKGIGEFLSYVKLIKNALSSYECIIEEIITQKQISYAKMTFRGVHTSDFFGKAPTEKVITWSGVARFNIENSQIIDLWVLGDVDSLKQQLGISEKKFP